MKTLIDKRDNHIWFTEDELLAAIKYYKYYARDMKIPRLTDGQREFNKRIAKCKTLSELADLYNHEHNSLEILTVRQ